MKQTPPLEAKFQRMLELLAQGASTRSLAKKMGFSEGTVRVYLHNLYRILGVRNRTEAVLWQVRQEAARPSQAAGRQQPAPDLETFGAAALRDGLLGALGIMESFLGPYGRMWKAGMQMKGVAIDEESESRRRTARDLWRALLAGDYAAAKEFHDEGHSARLAMVAPSEAALLVVVLLLGGYSHAAQQVEKMLPRARRGVGLTARERDLLDGLNSTLHADDAEGFGAVQRIATAAATPAPLRHIATAALFQACLLRKDGAGAMAAGEALWAEAQNCREQLEAMGVRMLPHAGAAAGEDTAAAALTRERSTKV